MLHPDQEPRKPYVVSLLEGDDAPIVAVSDFMKLVPDQIARWLPGRFYPLGTDGFGRSETREALRRFFEIDAECVVLAALWQLASQGRYDRGAVRRAIDELGIDSEKAYALIT
jgi:pyruvate dehydrogenase E1 component